MPARDWRRDPLGDTLAWTVDDAGIVEIAQVDGAPPWETTQDVPMLDHHPAAPASPAGNGDPPGPVRPSAGPGDLTSPWTARELDDWLDDVIARGWIAAGPTVDAFYAAREVAFR